MRLSQVYHAVKPIGRLLVVIVVDNAPLGFCDCPLDLIQAAVKKIDLALLGVDPGTSVDPGSPFIEARDGCSAVD